MAEYHLLTVWRIQAPLEQVYAAIRDPLGWPRWWPGVQAVERAADGRADGVGSVWRFSWRGPLPYRVAFEVRATRIDDLAAIEGTARGDLDGTGRWRFSRLGSATVVHCEWQVRSTRRWMNLAAPLARPMFIRNHAQVMEQGGEGLARLLGSPPAIQEHIDLIAAARPALAAPGHRREGGRIAPAMVLTVGLGAGAMAAAAELVLWWLEGMPVAETLLRDARLTAALVMGARVLPPPATPQANILLVATLVHFALSIAYALLPAHLAGRLRPGPALAAGALYGLAIYAVNLYGFTLLFPWFAVARDWVTVAAHLVFGVALAGGCLMWARMQKTYRPPIK